MGFQCQGSFSPNNTRKSSRFGKMWNIYSSFRLNLEQIQGFQSSTFFCLLKIFVLVWIWIALRFSHESSIWEEKEPWIFQQKRRLHFQHKSSMSFIFCLQENHRKPKAKWAPNQMLSLFLCQNAINTLDKILDFDMTSWRFFVTSWQMQIMIIINSNVFFFTIQIHLLGFSRLITPLKKKGLIFPNKIACVLLKEALFQSCSSLNFTWGSLLCKKDS